MHGVSAGLALLVAVAYSVLVALLLIGVGVRLAEVL